MKETSMELPELPKGKYEWWDDYYDGLTLSPGPEDRYQQMGLYNQDQLRAFGEQCVLAERGRCIQVCEEERVDAEGSGSREDFAYNNAIAHCVDAIRKEPSA